MTTVFSILWIFGSFAAPAATASPRSSMRRPSKRTPTVIVVRRPGLGAYQEVAEEFSERVRALILLRSPRPGAQSALLREISAQAPDLVFAIGQGAYDQLRGLSSPPLIDTYVFHRQRLRHHAVPVRIDPRYVFTVFRALRPTLRHLAVLCSKKTRWLARAARDKARPLKISLEIIEAPSAPRALGRLRHLSPRIEGLWLPTDLSVLSPQVLQYAIGLQFRRRLLLLGATRQEVRGGALAGLDYEARTLGQRAAAIANQLLCRSPQASDRRARHDSLRIGPGPYGVTPPRMTVNAQTARRIGVRLDRARRLGAEILP